jgi:(p)ppGpp synthase/HD superfamily hydrolase
MLKIVKGVLEKAHSREDFFAEISAIYPSLDWRYQLIEKAYNDAKDAFRGVKRESGIRYFEHIRATTLILIIYLRVRDYKVIVASILHDIVEDVPHWPLSRIRDVYGEDIACLVQYMTKPVAATRELSEKIYHARFVQAPRNFFLIKLSDRLHNILTLHPCPLEKRQRKIEETRIHYLPYAEQNQILIHELEQAMEEVDLKTENVVDINVDEENEQK